MAPSWNLRPRKPRRDTISPAMCVNWRTCWSVPGAVRRHQHYRRRSAVCQRRTAPASAPAAVDALPAQQGRHSARVEAALRRS